MRKNAVKKLLKEQKVEARKRSVPSFNGSPIRIKLEKTGITDGAYKAIKTILRWAFAKSHDAYYILAWD
jgi:hypothetical protein